MMEKIAPLTRLGSPCEAYRKTHGKARAICSGRLTRFGTSPLKISDRWNTIEVAPSRTQRLLERGMKGAAL
tara:strand:- start:3459 stop:3671 length:213 start_codon:yes stop_codon:yes gene_type:complete